MRIIDASWNEAMNRRFKEKMWPKQQLFVIIVKEFDNVPSSFGRRTLTNNYTCCFVIKFKEFDDIIREQANRMAIIIATAIYRLPMFLILYLVLRQVSWLSSKVGIKEDKKHLQCSYPKWIEDSLDNHWLS